MRNLKPCPWSNSVGSGHGCLVLWLNLSSRVPAWAVQLAWGSTITWYRAAANYYPPLFTRKVSLSHIASWGYFWVVRLYTLPHAQGCTLKAQPDPKWLSMEHLPSKLITPSRPKIIICSFSHKRNQHRKSTY